MEYNIQGLMLGLLKNSICGMPLPENYKEQFDEAMAEELYRLSAKHDLAHLVGYALKSNGLLNSGNKISKMFEKQLLLAIYRWEQMNYELERIDKLLAEYKIAYMPVKGTVVRSLYAEPWMRTSCDIDILVKEESIETILKVLPDRLSYRHTGRTSHDVAFVTPAGIGIEMHFDLIEKARYPVVNEVLSKAWDRSHSADGYRYELDDEMEYFYHIAHMAKHFENGGCGVRPFIDLRLMLDVDEDAREKRRQIIEKGNLTVFEKAAKMVAEVWFGEGEHNKLTADIQEYIFFGGVYGNLANRVYFQQAKKGGKLKYLWHRVFLPMDSLKQRYPKVKKYPVLAPLYQFERLITMIREGRTGRAVQEIKINAEMSEQMIKNGADLIKELGL